MENVKVHLSAQISLILREFSIISNPNSSLVSNFTFLQCKSQLLFGSLCLGWAQVWLRFGYVSESGLLNLLAIECFQILREKCENYGYDLDSTRIIDIHKERGLRDVIEEVSLEVSKIGW